MKKKILAAAILLLASTTAFLLIPKNQTVTSKATEDTFGIQISKTSVKKDKTFTAKIVIHSPDAMQNIQAALNYDSTLVEYENDNNAIVGSSGSLTLNDTLEGGSTKKTYKLTFKALELGDCHFTLTNASFTKFEDLSLVTKGDATANVKIIVNDNIEDDCTLLELLIGAGTMKEEWDPETYEYHISVPEDTTLFAYSATPSCSDSVVVSDGPATLSKGENRYTITVTAPSGDQAVYTLFVRK